MFGLNNCADERRGLTGERTPVRVETFGNDNQKLETSRLTVLQRACNYVGGIVTWSTRAAQLQSWHCYLAHSRRAAQLQSRARGWLREEARRAM